MHGYGKIILFGEHAVVYGYPALAAGISKGIGCEIVEASHPGFVLSVPHWGIEVAEHEESNLAEALRIIVRGFPKTSGGCRLQIIPQIPSRAGLGSSAALTVAIIRALVSWHHLQWPAAKINELAFQAECAFHGTPSGIDNTIATFGGFCYLSDATRFPCPMPTTSVLMLKKMTAQLLPGVTHPVNLVVVNTRRDRETKGIIAKVRELVAQKPDYYHPLMEKIGGFAIQGYHYLQNQKYRELGAIMNQNHCYLQELGVSCQELDLAAKTVLQAGALGAKLTGAGGGGCLIAFGPGQEESMLQAAHQAGFEAFTTQVGVS